MKEKGFGVIWIILFVALIISLPVGAYLVRQKNIFSTFHAPPQPQESIGFVEPTPKPRAIITVSSASPDSQVKVFYSYNSFTKATKEIFRLEDKIIVNEARVSPDGQKLYYISSSFIDFPSKVSILNLSGAKKEISMGKTNLWTLSNPGNLQGGGRKDCYWSPDGNKLACMLSERESPTGAGTGRADIQVLDYVTGGISEVFVSDQIAPPEHANIPISFNGWLGNDKLFLVKLQNNLATTDIQPADFYSLNVNNRSLNKEFTYQYSDGFPAVALPDGTQVLFDSFSRVGEDKLLHYYVLTKQTDTVLSSKDVLGIQQISISEDGKKFIYYAFSDKSIHIYDPYSNSENVISSDPILSVDGELYDRKTFVVSKNQESSALLDSQTKQMTDLKGIFIGTGDF